MGNKTRLLGMVFSEIVVVMAILLILVISFLPAFIMVAKRYDLIPQMSSATNASAEGQIDEIYLISRTNTLPNALAMLSETYRIETVGNETTLIKVDGDLKSMIVMVKNSPSSGMTKIQINVSLIDNPDPTLTSQIKTILFFK